MNASYFDALLQTKIYTPPLREDYVSRPRLVSRLNDARSGQSILIKSPAGYGKTTLAVEWVNQVDADHAWYSIDSRDNDLGQFMSYIIYALDQVESGVCDQVLERIYSPDPPAPRRLLDQFINDLTCLQDRTILVLDDFHLITNEEIQDVVSYLLNYHPPQLQVVILSRKDLPFPVAPLKAQNKLLELDFFDMRFTIKEADTFLKKAFEIELPYKKVARLDQILEGWVTGLQLAGLSLRQREDAASFLKHFSGEDRLIQSYLFEEVISNQPEHIQRFLLHTSILTRLSAPLCNHLLEIENGQDILEELERSNLFIIPLDNRKQRYRYHHIFADALQERLRRTQPELIPDLYQRASDWFQEHGNLEEAIDYAIQAENFDQASEMISGIVNRVIREGGRRRILRWLSSFPRAVLRNHFMLWAHLITAHLGLGEFNRARQSLEDLWGDEDHFQEVGEEERRLIRANNAGFLASIEMHTTLDAARVKQLARESMGIFPEGFDFGRSIGPGYYAVGCFHRGEIGEALDYIGRAIQLSKRHEYSRLELLWLCYRAQITIAAGDLKSGRDLLDSAYQVALKMGVEESNVVSNVIISRGGLQYELNHVQAAERELENGIQIAVSASFLDHIIWGYQMYIPLLTATARFDQARERLEDAWEIAAEYDLPSLVVDHLEALGACVDLQEGKVERARAWASAIGSWEDEERLGAKEFQWLTLSKVWIAGDQPRKATPLLEALAGEARQLDRSRGVVKSKVLLSKAYFLDQRPSLAEETLSEVLELAHSEGYVRTFLEGGREIQELLHKIYVDNDKAQQRDSAVNHAYIGELLAAFEAERERREVLGIDFGCSTDGELLTRREGEILSLLADGLSYADIASTLSITENTVKSHIKNLYRKLQVNKRTEAVNKARSLNIL